MTTYSFVDESGETRLRGTIDPAPGGGPVPYVSGTGSPVDTVTPTADKPLYIDTDNGTLYLAEGPTSGDWIALGPTDGNIGAVSGVIVNAQNGRLYVLTNDRDEAGAREGYFGDAWSQWNGSGQGLYWQAGPGEGEEALVVKTGMGAAHTGTLQDKDGNMTVAGDVNADAVNTDLVTGAGGSVSLSALDGAVIASTTVVCDATGGVFEMKANEAGFFGAAPVAKPTGVPVDAAGIHAALVSLGLIAA